MHKHLIWSFLVEDQNRELSDNKSKRILVIGGIAAGTSAASNAKRIDPSADIR